MNNLMMNLIPGNDFALSRGYSVKRGVYLGNLRPVGCRLRPDGIIGWGYNDVTFDPKVFAFAVQTSYGSWERRAFTLNSVKEALSDTWENHLNRQKEQENRRERIKSLTKKVESIAKEIFGEENAATSYGSDVRLENLTPEQLPTVCRIKNLEKVGRYDCLFSLSFSSEENGRKLVERMERELENKRMFSGPAVKQLTV